MLMQKHGMATSRRAIKALIVDDNEMDVVLSERLLRQRFGASIAVRTAESAAEALALLERERFDVMLVDYRLPDWDGLEVIALVSQRNDAPAIILLSGQGSETIAARAIKCGAAEYLVKRDLTAELLETSILEALEPPSRHQRGPMAEKLRHDHAELGAGVRTLSHDMAATFMVLENSFERLRDSADGSNLGGLAQGMSHVEACLKQSKRFLDDLRDLAKKGSVEMAPTQIELSRVVADVGYELAPLLAERGVELKAQANLPTVWCHETRVKQVVTNLVRNAARHGCDAVDPRITITERERTAHRVWLAIHDNGPGIPHESREDIFLPGRRLNTSVPGSGMGLAIVKKIVTHYGGSIHVDASGERGATFVFSLPTGR